MTDPVAGSGAEEGAPGGPASLFGSRTAAAALVAAMFTEAVGYGMVAPTLPFMARHVGANESRIGLLVGIYAVVGLFTAVPLGILANRFGRRAVVIFGLAGLMVASVAFILAPTYPWLLTARVVQGVGAAGVWVGCLTLAGDLGKSESMGRSMSWLTGAWSLGFLAGPALGGLGTLRLPFTLYAGLSGAALLIALAGLPQIGRGGPRATVAGILGVLRRRPILASGVATFALAFFFGAIEAFLPLLLAAGGAAGANPAAGIEPTGRAAVGFLFTVAGLPSVILPGWTGRLADRHGDARIIAGGLLLAAVLCAVFMPLYGRVPHTILFLVMGVVEVSVYVPAVAMLHRGIPSAERVFASGSHSYAFSIGFFLGPLATGVLFPFGAWRAMFAMLAVVVLAAAAVVLRLRALADAAAEY